MDTNFRGMSVVNDTNIPIVPIIENIRDSRDIEVS
jgi:hypothetical protein